MKIRELEKRSGIPKETIHFYIREGILPKPRKLGRNVAEYDESYIEQIDMINILREKLFLPLTLIKKIVKNPRKSLGEPSLVRLRSEYFRPIDQFIKNEIKGEEAFLKATGLGRKWATKIQDWGIIRPKRLNGRKIYSQDDVIIARVIVEMDKMGLGPEEGFNPEALKVYKKMLREIVVKSHSYYFSATLGKLSHEEFKKRFLQGNEIMGIFFYHLYRKLSWEEYENLLSDLRPKTDADDKEH